MKALGCIGCQAVVDPPATSGREDQSRFAEDAQVVAHQAARCGGDLLKLTHTGLASGEAAEHAPPDRIRHGHQERCVRFRLGRRSRPQFKKV